VRILIPQSKMTNPPSLQIIITFSNIITMNPSELNSSSMNGQKYKVVLLGDSGVGKSSIIDRFVKGEIDYQHQVWMDLLKPTVGIDFLTRTLMQNGSFWRLCRADV
jgi:GTPase SAR1 family protein